MRDRDEKTCNRLNCTVWTWNSRGAQRRQIRRKLCDPGLEVGHGVGKGKDLPFRAQDYRGAGRCVCIRARVCVCACTRVRVPTQPHSGWQGTGLIPQHVSRLRMQNLNYILSQWVFCPLESGFCIQKLIHVTSEFSFVWRTLSVLKFITPNALRRSAYESIWALFCSYFSGGLPITLNVLNCIWKFSTICSFWSMWALVPWPGFEPGPPALGVWRLSHSTPREVPEF